MRARRTIRRRRVRARPKIKVRRVRKKIRRKSKVMVELLDNLCFW